MSNKIKNEEAPQYITIPDVEAEDKIIREALEILRVRMNKPAVFITSPHDIKRYLKLKLMALEHEVFAVIFLDNRHGVIEYEEMFRGTIDGASVYPREVVKRALYHNAAAVIFSHNHPSGNPEESTSDLLITNRLKDALNLIDVKVLDHIIIGNSETTSFAEKGIL